MSSHLFCYISAVICKIKILFGGILSTINKCLVLLSRYVFFLLDGNEENGNLGTQNSKEHPGNPGECQASRDVSRVRGVEN